MKTNVGNGAIGSCPLYSALGFSTCPASTSV
jgi:hypothetical protein